MILNITDLLSPAQTTRIAAIAAAARFFDGRIGNPHSQAKNKLHPDPQDARFAEASQMWPARCTPASRSPLHLHPAVRRPR